MNPPPSNDAAWVAIETPLSPLVLESFIEDLEQLYRTNSLLEIIRWEKTGDDRIAFEAINLSNGLHLKSMLGVERIEKGLKINYHGLLKTSTSFKVESSSAKGSTLVVTDDYSGTDEEERLRRLDEVDRSLIQWGRDLHHYLSSWRHWSWLPPWRWYMRRVWQPMKPSARRITCWLLWLSLGELALIFLLIAILAIEY